MAQFDFGTIDPSTTSGTTLASNLNDWRTAVHSDHKGSSAPAYKITGMDWIDDSGTPWIWKKYDGTDWITIGTINATTNAFIPSGSSSGDVVGPTGSTDNTIALFDGTTGKLLKDSGYVVTAAGAALLDDSDAAAQRTTLGLNWQRKTTTYTAVVGDNIIADTSGSGWTLTLPASPSSGATVSIAGSWATNNLTIARNGSTISGLAEDVTCDLDAVEILLHYNGSTWEIFS